MKSLALCLLPLTLLPLAAAAQTAAPAAPAAAPSQWAPFTPAEGMLTVSFPSAPQRTETPLNEGPGSPGRALLFTSMGPEGVFLAGWAEYAPSFTFDDQAELDANRDNFIKGVGGKLLSQRAISLGKAPGMEYDVEKPGAWIGRVRLYIIDRKPYQLIAITPGTTLDIAKANRFFASFKLAPKR